jgi:hypothetical protein
MFGPVHSHPSSLCALSVRCAGFTRCVHVTCYVLVARPRLPRVHVYIHTLLCLLSQAADRAGRETRVIVPKVPPWLARGLHTHPLALNRPRPGPHSRGPRLLPLPGPPPSPPLFPLSRIPPCHRCRRCRSVRNAHVAVPVATRGLRLRVVRNHPGVQATAA